MKLQSCGIFGLSIVCLCVLVAGTGCRSVGSGQYPSNNFVAQITRQYADNLVLIGEDKARHFSASLMLTMQLPGAKNPFVENLRTQMEALRVGLHKELDDHKRGDLAKAEVDHIVQQINQQYRLLDAFMMRNGIAGGDSLGDLLADQIGANVGTSFNALRQLKFNDNYDAH